MLNRRKNRTPLSGKSSKTEDPPSNKVVNFIPSNKEKGFFEVNKSSNKPVKTTKDTTKDKENKGKEYDDKATIEEIEWREREVARVFQERRKGAGRPTKLTEQVIKDLEVLARIGLSEKAMCESLMLPLTTFNKWKKRNKAFTERLMKARNVGKSKLVNSLYGHGVKNWTAHAWLLERCFRSEFGQNQKVELTGKDSGPLVFKVIYEEKKEGV